MTGTTTPATPRAALLAFADQIVREWSTPIPPDVLGRLAAQVADCYPDGEHVTDLTSEPSDFEIRSRALDAAARAWAGMSAIRHRDGEMVKTAQAFEDYLRGER